MSLLVYYLEMKLCVILSRILVVLNWNYIIRPKNLSHFFFFFEIPAEEVNIMSNIKWKQSALLVGPEFSTPQSSIWESRFGAYVFRLKV